MGYILRAFISKNPGLDLIANTYSASKQVSLYRDISMILMTEDLFDQINENNLSPDIGSFMLLTEYVELQILKCITTQKVIYAEAEYFGGIGSQSSIIWEGGKRLDFFDKESRSINLALKRIGVSAIEGMDEFDTVNLGRYREIEDWLS